MAPVVEFPVLTVFVVVVLVLFFFSMLTPRVPKQLPPPVRGELGARGLEGADAPGVAVRTCPSCGATHPGYAVYCRRCGRPLT